MFLIKWEKFHLSSLVSKIISRQKTKEYSPNFLFYCDSQTKCEGNPLRQSVLKYTRDTCAPSRVQFRQYLQGTHTHGWI